MVTLLKKKNILIVLENAHVIRFVFWPSDMNTSRDHTSMRTDFYIKFVINSSFPPRLFPITLRMFISGVHFRAQEYYMWFLVFMFDQFHFVRNFSIHKWN